MSTLLKRCDDEVEKRGNVSAEARERQQIIDQNKREAAKRIEWQRFIKSRGRRYQNCSFDNFETGPQQLQSVERLIEFCESLKFNRNLILFGPSGTGKDHLLAACVRELIRAGASGFKWTSGPSLFADLRHAIGGKRTEREVIRPYTNCKYLVFSDLAMTALTDYQREVVYQIIDRRYNNELPIWISANVASREDFEKATSPQIVDRLLDGSLYVPCNWESFRKVQP